MWKFILGIAGFVAGCLVVSYWCPSWLRLLPGPIVGTFGLLVGFMVGRMVDARRTDWKTLLGLLGIFVGSFVGCVVLLLVFGNLEISLDNLYAVRLLGIPIGAIWGWTFGVALGMFFDGWLGSESATPPDE